MKQKQPLNNVASELSIFLANTYALALKTQNYHWNVKGSEFYSLHKLFEAQYESMHDAADQLAERIRMLGSYAPGGFAEFAKLTNITDAKRNASVREILQDLVASHEAVIKQANEVLVAANSAGDYATADMIVGRIEEHDKHAWMLTSSL
jgi:starvation-inducible DNA-binding protein